MIILYIKPKKGETDRREIKNVRPVVIENYVLFYYNQNDQLGATDQDKVVQIKAEGWHEAVECNKVFRHTGRNMAIIESKSGYFVEFDKFPSIMTNERIVKDVN
jgi:hypothetical protein